MFGKIELPINWENVGLLKGINDEELKYHLCKAFDDAIIYIIDHGLQEEEVNVLAIIRKIYQRVPDYKIVDIQNLLNVYSAFLWSIPLKPSMFTEESRKKILYDPIENGFSVLDLEAEYTLIFVSFYIGLLFDNCNVVIEDNLESISNIISADYLSKMKNFALKEEKYNLAAGLRDLENKRFSEYK